MKPLLKISNLSINFKVRKSDFSAVKDLNLLIEENQIVGLVGESGSGKSVTSLSLMRLVPQPPGEIVSGQVNLNGKNLLDLTEKEMTEIRGGEISLILQDPMTALNPCFSIENQVGEGIKIHQGDKGKNLFEKVVEALKSVRIPAADQRAKDYPHQLSGGMRQRVVGAIGISSNPSVIIADEPTTALDVTIQAQILDSMTKLKKEFGMSILFITHDLGLVSEFSDQVCVMQNGKIVEQGDTKQVFENPQHQYTKRLLDAEPIPKSIINLKSSPLIKIKDLNVFYSLESKNFFKKNKFHAVKDVSLNILKNTTIGLVGESGSGKSTLGKAIANLVNYDGEIFFDGKDISLSKKKLKKDIQIIFQDPYGSLSPRMTIGEIVGEGLGVHFNLKKDEINKKIDKVMNDVGIDTEAKNKYPHEFSGGQRQRIAIARSLIMNPAFMILDEPTSALDRSIQIQVINLLKDIQEEYELTYLFISHDLKVIRSMSDFIFVMKNGKIVEYGPSNEVFSQPKQEYTKKLLSAALRYASE